MSGRWSLAGHTRELQEVAAANGRRRGWDEKAPSPRRDLEPQQIDSLLPCCSETIQKPRQWMAWCSALPSPVPVRCAGLSRTSPFVSPRTRTARRNSEKRPSLVRTRTEPGRRSTGELLYCCPMLTGASRERERRAPADTAATEHYQHYPRSASPATCDVHNDSLSEGEDIG